MNNTDKGGTTATIYAPTAGNTSSYMIIGNGATAAPIWVSILSDKNTAANNNVSFKIGGQTYTKTVNNVANASYATSAGSATDVNLVATGSGSNTISISAGNGSAASFTVNNVVNASYAKNLEDKPVIAGVSGNKIKVTVGGKTSDAYTVPYATSAGSATNVALSQSGSGTKTITVTAGTGSTTFTVNNVDNASYATAANKIDIGGVNYSVVLTTNPSGATATNTLYFIY